MNFVKVLIPIKNKGTEKSTPLWGGRKDYLYEREQNVAAFLPVNDYLAGIFWATLF